MLQPRRAALLRGTFLVMLLLLTACGERLGTSTATTIGALPQVTSTRPTPPGTLAADDTLSPMPASPRATPATPAVSTALAAALATTQRIHIDDSGVTMLDSRTAIWNLERNTEEFAGNAILAVSYLSSPRQSAIAKVAVPRSSVELFFDILSRSPLQLGDRALSRGTSITLETSAGTVAYFREVLGSDAFTPEERARVGWSLIFAGRQYKILNDAPQQALAEINPYLRQDLLDKLFQDAQTAHQALITPVPLLCTVPSAAPTTGDAAAYDKFVNIVQTLGIAAPSSITIEDGAAFSKKKLTDPAQIDALIAMLDQPLPVIPAITFKTNERVGIDFATAEHFSLRLYYLPRTEMIYVYDPNYGYSVQAPPELRPLLVGIFCGR